MEKQLIGRLDIKSVDGGLTVQMLKLYPVMDTFEDLTVDAIKDYLRANYLRIQIKEQLLDWYIEKARKVEKVFSNIIIANGKVPKSKGSYLLTLQDTNITPEDLVYWDFVKILFDNIEEDDLKQELPFTLFYVKKGAIIGKQHMLTEDILGSALNGDVIHPERHKNEKYEPADNVQYVETHRSFIANCCGYVYIHNHKVSVIPPFLVSKDRLNLYFMNFKRAPFSHLSKIDVSTHILKQKIDISMANKDMQLEVPHGDAITIVTGRPPGDSYDASIEVLVETEVKQPDETENIQMDYREISHFPSVEKEELLAKKKLMIRGEQGADIFGMPINSVVPRDLLLKCGFHTYSKEEDGEMLIYSLVDGRVEYKNGILSVYDQLKIRGDVDFSVGNINTQVNVHIDGSVRSGFSVKSKKSIFIQGTVEDNCTIEAEGDIVINGGVSGKNNLISTQANMSVKFIEGGNIFVKENLAVQRFILSANVECLGNMKVVGDGLNLNEKGAIIDCEIYLKGKLYVPTIGNDAGQKSTIYFGINRALNAKIKNLEETLLKITQTINDLNDQFTVDITAPNIHSQIRSFTRETKDRVVLALQEKNKLDKQFKMISGIFEKELERRKEEIEKSAIFVANKVLPPLILQCEQTKRVIDRMHPPSKYFYSIETRYIERDRFLTDR